MKLTTDIFGAIRTAVLSILLCCVVYTLVIWTIAQVFVPNSANGSLVKNGRRPVCRQPPGGAGVHPG